MSAYYISIRQTGEQLFRVSNCRSKAEAIKKIKNNDPDMDSYNFEIINVLWSTAKVVDVEDE